MQDHIQSRKNIAHTKKKKGMETDNEMQRTYEINLEIEKEGGKTCFGNHYNLE